MRNTCRAILWAGGDRDLGWGPGHNPEKGSLSTAHRVLQAPPPRAGSTAPMPRVRLSAQPRSAHAPSAPGLDLRVRLSLRALSARVACWSVMVSVPCESLSSSLAAGLLWGVCKESCVRVTATVTKPLLFRVSAVAGALP